MSDALLLFAHGSREPEWAHPLHALRDRIQGLLPERRIDLAYLELMAPSLPDAVAQLASQGMRNIVILPLFLGQGSHVRNDLPKLAESARRRHPDLRIELLPALGEQAEILEGLARSIVRTLG